MLLKASRGNSSDLISPSLVQSAARVIDSKTVVLVLQCASIPRLEWELVVERTKYVI